MGGWGGDKWQSRGDPALYVGVGVGGVGLKSLAVGDQVSQRHRQRVRIRVHMHAGPCCCRCLLCRVCIWASCPPARPPARRITVHTPVDKTHLCLKRHLPDDALLSRIIPARTARRTT